MDSLAKRLDRYQVTMAPFAVGGTIAWLPPTGASLMDSAPKSGDDLDELWTELARMSAVGLDQDVDDLAEVVDIESFRQARSRRDELSG